MKFQETETVELKRILNENFEKALDAFLNTMDGFIYIGVEDDGNIVGVDKLDETLKKIADIVTTQILPNPQEFVEIGTKFLNGKHVIEVKVKKGKALYYIKKYGRSSNGCYIRVGTSNRSMTEEQIKKGYEYSLPSFDNLVIMLAKWNPITFTQLKIYYNGKGLHLNDSTLAENLNLYVDNKRNYNKLAELLSDENHVSIQFARFHGINKASIAETSEYGNQCLITAIERMINRLEAENYTKSIITSRQRIDKRLIDMDCLKEAFFNAVAHNDWSIVEPSVYMFDDRIEIISHGGLPRGETEEMFYQGISKPRNPSLMRVLRDLGYVERTGHGVPNILARYGKEAFQIYESCINVVLPFDKEVLVSKTNDAKNDAKNDAEKSLEEIVVELIRKNPKITKIQMAEKTGKSKPTIERMLKSSTKIIRIGSNKGGYWEIKE